VPIWSMLPTHRDRHPLPTLSRVPTRGSCVGVQEIKTKEGEEDIEAGATSLTSLLPRFRQAMKPEPPYAIESRARDLIIGWHKEGKRALQTRTIAACAMIMAFEDLRKELVGFELDQEQLRVAAELDRNTIDHGLKELRKMSAVKNAYLE